MLFLSLCLILFNTVFLHSVFIQLKNENSIEFHIDFSFNKILINNKQIDCIELDDCEVLNKELNIGSYNYKEYYYQEALLKIKVNGIDSNNSQILQLNILLTDFPFNVLGIGLYSVLKDAIPDKKQVEINLRTKTMLIHSHFPGEEIDSFDFNNNSIRFINALMIYRIGFIQDGAVEVKSNANLCFHDKNKAINNQDYFLAGSLNFVLDWMNFLENYKENKKDIIYDQYIITTMSNSSHFYVPYDSQLFDSYDGIPFKFFKDIEYNDCDLFIGDFFVDRADLRIVLKKELYGYMLGIKIQSYIRSYNKPITQEKSYFKNIIYCLIILFIILYIYKRRLDSIPKQKKQDKDELKFELVENTN